MFGDGVRGQITRSLLVVGGICSLFVGLVALWGLSQEALEQTTHFHRSMASLVQAHVREEIQDGLDVLEAAAEKVAAKPFTSFDLAPTLELAVRFQPLFYSIYAFDASGEIILRQYPDGPQDAEGRSQRLGHKDDEAFRQAAWASLKDGQPRTLSIKLSSSGNLFIPLIVAVKDPQGKIVGLLSGAISAAGRGFDEMLQAMAPEPAGYVVLTDTNQKVLAHTRRSPFERRATFQAERKTWLGGTWLVRGDEVDFYSEARLDDIGLRVLVAMPGQEALADLPLVLVKTAGAALLAMILAGIFGLRLGERLGGPIHELLEGIRQIGDGVYSHRVDLEGESEFEEVAEAVNTLAENLGRQRVIEELWNPEEDEASSDQVAKEG